MCSLWQDDFCYGRIANNGFRRSWVKVRLVYGRISLLRTVLGTCRRVEDWDSSSIGL